MAAAELFPIIDDKLIKKTATDFATFLNFTSESQLESIEESIEKVLIRLDELYGMLDMIRNDNALATDSLLCQVREKMDSLKSVFERIDQMEEFVLSVKNNIAVMEKEVKSVEEEFSTLTSIKKALHGFSFLGLKKKPTVTPRTRPSNTTYIPPPIFSTEDWIHSNNSEVTSPESSDS